MIQRLVKILSTNLIFQNTNNLSENIFAEVIVRNFIHLKCLYLMYYMGHVGSLIHPEKESDGISNFSLPDLSLIKSMSIKHLGKNQIHAFKIWMGTISFNDCKFVINRFLLTETDFFQSNLVES